MALASDILIISAALGAAFYCFMLSRRLQKLDQLDGGVGQAIAALAAQTEEMKRTMTSAGEETRKCAAILEEKIGEAKRLADLLEASTVAQERGAKPESPEDRRPNGPSIRPSQEPETPAAVPRFKRRFGPIDSE